MWSPDQISAAADWAIRHLTGVPREDRLPICQRLVRDHSLPCTAFELLTWCHQHQTHDQSLLAEKERRNIHSLTDLRTSTDDTHDPLAEFDIPAPDPHTEPIPLTDRGEVIREFIALIEPALHGAVWKWDRTTRKDITIPRGGSFAVLTGPGTLTLNGTPHTWQHQAILTRRADDTPHQIHPEARVAVKPRTTKRGQHLLRIEFLGPVKPRRTGKSGRPRHDPVRLHAESVGQSSLALFRRWLGGQATPEQGSKQRRHYHEKKIASRLKKNPTPPTNIP